MKIFLTIVITLLFAFSVSAQKQAEVIVTSTFLRKLPDAGAEKVQIVEKGEKVTLEKSQAVNGWYYVSIQNRKIKGWIRKDTVGLPANVEKINQAPEKTVSTNEPVLTPNPTISPAPAAASAVTAVSADPPNTPVEDGEILRVDTEEVSLNVRVVNANNRPARDLKQIHFEVYEDGVLQPITSFTTAEVPIINALVIDNSRSLRSQLSKVVEAGKIIVGANRPKDESAVVRFISKDKIEVAQDFTAKKNLLNYALDNLFIEGGQTAIIDAVYQTAKKIEQYQNSQTKDDVKLRALILVSDGDDRGSSYKEQQLFELLRASNVQIYVIGFINDLSRESDQNGTNRQAKAKSFLARLAQETGGKVYFPNSIDELPQISSDISGELRTQYLISYAPTNGNHDGTFRKIKVLVSDGENKEKRIALTRAGRTSVPK